MTAYEFLSELKERMEFYYERYDRFMALESACTKTTSKSDGVTVSGGGDKHKDDAMIRLADERDKLAGLAETVERMFRSAVELLNGMPTTEYRAIISLRYVSRMPWKRVQKTLARCGWKYNMATLYRHHRSALEEAQSVWEGMHHGEP